MLKYLNKGISTPVALSIILILAIIVGGFIWWEHGKMWKQGIELPEIIIPEKKETKRSEKKDETTDFKVVGIDKETGWRLLV